MLHRPRGGRLAVAPAVLGVFGEFTQREAKATEAGGILLGRLIIGGDDVAVDEALRPTREDRRARFAFFRARDPAQRVVNDRWERSNGTTVYLGEWHTHPEDDPTPSSIDVFNWRRIVLSNRFETDFLLFAIVGRRTTRWWEAWKAERRVAVEALVNDEEDVPPETTANGTLSGST